jgi:glutaredoxin
MLAGDIMLGSFTDKLRTYAHAKLEGAPAAKERPALRHARNLASIVNELLGRPICGPDELAQRRSGPRPTSAVAATPVATAPIPQARAQAPVLVYFDGKDHRTKAKVEELLRSRQITYRVVDVTDDEAERSWVTTAAKQTELPIVVVAGAPLGGLAELTQLDLEGELTRRVFEAP